MARQSVRVDGLKELDAALGELSKSLAKGALRRTLVKAGKPIADRARSLAPIDTGELRDSIAVSTRLSNPAGKSEFAAAMRAGAGVAAATAALRSARRAAAGEGSTAEVYVGAGPLPQAHLVEFGSINNTAQPFLRPAWDEKRGEALDIIKNDLGSEIQRTAQRAARRAAKRGA